MATYKVLEQEDDIVMFTERQLRNALEKLRESGAQAIGIPIKKDR